MTSSIFRLVSAISGCAVVAGLISSCSLEEIELARERSRNEKIAQQREETKNSLLEEKRCSGCVLSEMDLSGADLSGADLSGADLSSVNLSGANLSSADLSGATLSRVDLSSADLSNANLSDTVFDSTYASNLSGSDLSDAIVSDLDELIRSVDMSKETILPDGTPFIAAMSSICAEGTGFSESAAYTSDNNPNLIAVFEKPRSEAEGDFVFRKNYVPQEISALQVGKTQLVLCIDNSEIELIESCEYSLFGLGSNPTNFVNRYRQWTTVSLVEAQTGLVIDSITESADPTQQCEEEEDFGDSVEKSIYADTSPIDSAAITTWVEQYALQ